MSGDICHQLKSRGALFATMLAIILAPSAYATGSVTEEFHKTVPLNANGRVSLENINGAAEITGWDRNEVQIDAVKTARDQQRLDEAKIEVEASGNSVSIRTKYPEGHTNNNPASVHYTIHVPTNAQLEHVNLINGSLTVSHVSGEVDADLVNGKLTADDLAGRADLSTVNGSVHATYRSLNNVSQVKISSVNGSIDLLLPPSPNADISASTMNGSLRTDFPIKVEGKFVGHHMSGTLGSGGTKIELSNVNGSSHIGAIGGA